MRFQCPHCHGIIVADDADMGSEVQCGACFETVTVPEYRVMPGAVVSDFLILDELGRGGMGVVYRAHQISLDRPAAVKILADSYANNAEFIVGFIKEARAAAQLNHPHIVQAFAVGEDDGVFYFAMEYVDGETMKTVLKREKVIPVPFALNVIQQIAEALDYAWKEAGLVHRDIKPDNIMMTSSGKAKLADLGLARRAEDLSEEDGDEVMGTPQYISPEQLTGAPVDVRSDIYSLGATFYHLITGRFPFEGKTAVEIAQKHLTEPLTLPNFINPQIPEMVALVIYKMMAKNVRERYQSAEELIEDLCMVRKGKLPPSIAALHGGGFAGKTLVLVNTQPHRTGRNAAYHAKAKSTIVPVIVIVGLLLLGTVILVIVLATSSSKSLPPSVDNTPKSYEEKVTALIRYTREIRETEPMKAHAVLLKFLREEPAPSNLQEYNKRYELLSVFTPLDEEFVVKKSSFRRESSERHKQERQRLKAE